MSGGTDGSVYDTTLVLRTVNVNWNDNGWNVNANSVENPNDWNGDNQVFSRNYFHFLLGLWSRSFCL